MMRINKTPKLIREILPRHYPRVDARGAQRVLNNITNYIGVVWIHMHMHAYALIYPAENLEDSAARERSRCSVMNLYEALEGLRCPEARLCRCLNRNSGLLRSYAMRAGR